MSCDFRVLSYMQYKGLMILVPINHFISKIIVRGSIDDYHLGLYNNMDEEIYMSDLRNAQCKSNLNALITHYAKYINGMS